MKLKLFSSILLFLTTTSLMAGQWKKVILEARCQKLYKNVLTKIEIMEQNSWKPELGLLQAKITINKRLDDGTIVSRTVQGSPGKCEMLNQDSNTKAFKCDSLDLEYNESADLDYIIVKNKNAATHLGLTNSLIAVNCTVHFEYRYIK